MKTLLAFLLLLPALAAEPSEEKIDLGSGRAAVVTLPGDWKRNALSLATAGTGTAEFSTRNGSNDSLLLTFVPMRNDQMNDPASFRAMAEIAPRRFMDGSVERQVVLKEFKFRGRTGYECRFTDAKLVGQPTVPGDYKTMTCHYVYLGDRVLLAATIFSDDPDGEGYATARKIMQSLTLSLPQNTI